MIKVHCKTNLDLYNERWPTELPAIPNIGDKIESATRHSHGFVLRLEVVSVTWKYSGRTDSWYASIELHNTKKSIHDFYTWYSPNVGKSIHAFI